MPELPEVEIMVRGAGRRFGGARLVQIELLDPRLLARGEPDSLVGRVLGGTRRRGKYACFDFEGLGLVIEPRMTGQLVFDDKPEVQGRRLRLLMRFEGGGVLGFDDPRRLGAAHLLPWTGLDGFFEDRGLGPEPWPEPRDAAWWAARFAGARGPVKPALMNQARVAGIGNIGASEACWRARLGPHRAVSALGAAEWGRLGEGVRGWIEDTLEEEGEGEIHLLSRGGENLFQVYGRAGEPCPRCGGPIRREVQAGRATFWCPGCQDGPPLS